MLVLSRRIGEKILVGADIVITLVDVDRNKVRIGVQAPDNVPINREELVKAGKPHPPLSESKKD